MKRFVIGTFFIAALAGRRSYRRNSQRCVARAPATRVAPASVGVATDRLERLHKSMQGFVDRKEVGGIVTLVAREGKTVDLHAVGFQDVEKNMPMKTDSIFRIASMTKPVTSVAIMMLFEEGKLFLTDPVSKFIPAFKSSTVMEGTGAEAKPVPARRAITIRDLLAHKSGITYGFLNGGAVGGGYRKNGVTDGLTSTTMTLEENDQQAGGGTAGEPAGRGVQLQPLDRRPRPRRRSRVGSAVQRVPARAHLQAAEDERHRLHRAGGEVVALRDGVFAGRQGRHPADDRSGSVRQHPHVAVGATTRRAGRISPAAPASHRRRATTRASRNMLLNGGALDGVRLLGPKTIELMTHQPHVGADAAAAAARAGLNFGLGFRVVTDLASTQTLGSDGLYGWSGIYGTNFWVDPKEKLVAVMMVQKYPGATVATTFQPMVYQALVR